MEGRQDPSQAIARLAQVSAARRRGAWFAFDVRMFHRIRTGALAGTLATVPMSAVMLAAQRMGLMGKQPPAKITDAALDASHVEPEPPKRRALAVIAHFAFGAAAGALFSAIHRRAPATGRATIGGLAFGSAVWAASYAGWVPALGIMPPPTEDRPGRPASMIVAHWVFGAALGLIVAGLRTRPRGL